MKRITALLVLLLLPLACGDDDGEEMPGYSTFGIQLQRNH